MVVGLKLTASQVKSAKPAIKAYKLSDGRGLYLLVQPNGAKYWRLKYRFGRKEKLLAIGVYPDVSLAQARAACDEAKVLLRDNRDPSSVKQLRKKIFGGTKQRHVRGDCYRVVRAENGIYVGRLQSQNLAFA